MGESAPQVFSGVTPAQYERLVEKAKAAGIELSGNRGTASKFGVEVTWTYVPETQQLTLQTLKAPFFMKPADVDAKIQTMVKESQSQVQS